ncbi:MAG: hypothetical protein ACRDF0_04515 [Candidatus Limnocylindria bacterium]
MKLADRWLLGQQLFSETGALTDELFGDLNDWAAQPIPRLHEVFHQATTDSLVAKVIRDESHWDRPEKDFGDAGAVLLGHATGATPPSGHSFLSDLLFGACGCLSVALGPEAPDKRQYESYQQLYPVDVYVRHARTPATWYVYSPSRHVLCPVTDAPSSPKLYGTIAPISPQQERLLNQYVIVVVGVFDRATRRYGDRGYRYALLEAGVLAERVRRKANQLGGVADVALSFPDRQIARAVRVNGIDEAPLVVINIAGPGDRL